MTNQTLAKQIADLFQETGQAHHQAYIETDGDDPDWPLWYANHMHETLGHLLNATFTKSELVYLLVLLDKEQRLHAPGASWPIYYGKFFVERYAA